MFKKSLSPLPGYFHYQLVFSVIRLPHKLLSTRKVGWPLLYYSYFSSISSFHTLAFVLFYYPKGLCPVSFPHTLVCLLIELPSIHQGPAQGTTSSRKVSQATQGNYVITSHYLYHLPNISMVTNFFWSCPYFQNVLNYLKALNGLSTFSSSCFSQYRF